MSQADDDDLTFITEPETGIRTLRKESILPYLASILLLGASVLVFLVYRSYAWPLFLALLMYVGFDPINRRICVWSGGRRNLAALATIAIVLLCIIVPSTLLISYLIEEVYDLVLSIRDSLTSQRILFTLQNYPLIMDMITSRPFFWVDLHAAVQDLAGEYGQYLDTDRIGSWVGSIFTVAKDSLTVTLSFLFNVLFGLIILFFLFRDGPTFYVFMRNALPFPPQITDRFASRMRSLISTVLKGNVFISILQGLAVGIGLTVCGINNAVVYGVIASVFSLIPVVGTMIVWLPAAAYLGIVEGSWGLALFLAIYCLAMYLLLENIVKPKLMDRKLGMHPLLLFFAILGGLTEFGFTGVILGPLFVTLFMTIWSIYHIWESSPAQRELPQKD